VLNVRRFQPWHDQIQHQDVWAKLGDQLPRLHAVLGLAHDRNVRSRFQNGADAPARRRMIIGQYDPNVHIPSSGFSFPSAS
jgi:hypothetical protein